MKAVTCRCYGSADVLEYGDVEKPVPADNEVLVRLRAAGVNPLDWHYMWGSPYMMRGGRVTPVLDRTYPLDDIASAIRYSEDGHARGKIIVSIP